MFDYRKLAVILLTTSTLCACATNRQSGTWIGAAAGAVVGGLIEDEAAAVAAGAVVGGLVGRMIGTRMDRKRTAHALEHNAPYETAAWTDAKTGRQLRFTPQEVYENGDTPCRHFELVTTVDGQDEIERGTACRRPDGTWFTT